MDGVLIIDKPAGMTSHDVVARARRILRERRIGHTGTLDPFATGVLVLLVGQATRLSQFLSGADKEYQAVVRLGFATDTGDLQGRPLERKTSTPLTWSKQEIEAALQKLRGEIDQVPPMYSAKKQGGKKLYELARLGEEVERQPVRVNIEVFELVETEGLLLKGNDDGTQDLRVRVSCSSGTYVRTLAEDLGKLLGTGAHLVELRRTRAGSFLIQDSTTLEDLQNLAESDSLRTTLLPPEAALSNMPFVHLSSVDAERARHGVSIPLNDEAWADGERVSIKDPDGGLIGVGEYDVAKQLLRPRVVLS